MSLLTAKLTAHLLPQSGIARRRLAQEGLFPNFTHKPIHLMAGGLRFFTDRQRRLEIACGCGTLNEGQVFHRHHSAQLLALHFVPKLLYGGPLFLLDGQVCLLKVITPVMGRLG